MKIKPCKLTKEQILSIFNLLFLVWYSRVAIQIQPEQFGDFFIYIFIPLSTMSAFLWLDIPYMPLFCLSYILFILSTIRTEEFYESRAFSDSLKNIKTIKNSIESYKQKHQHYPIPTVSGASSSSLYKQHSLEAILSNQNKFGDGNTYLNSIPNEYLSEIDSSNFVCVVHSLVAFSSDQSNYRNCESSFMRDVPKIYGRGYVYLPQKGLIRFNVGEYY